MATAAVSTKTSTARAARWRTASKSVRWTCSPTARPRGPCGPTSYGCGLPRWLMFCSTACAASPYKRPIWPTPPAAPSAASSSRLALSSPSASAGSNSPWHPAVPTRPSSPRLIAPSAPPSIPAEPREPSPTSSLMIAAKPRRVRPHPHSVQCPAPDSLSASPADKVLAEAQIRLHQNPSGVKSAAYKRPCEISGLADSSCDHLHADQIAIAHIEAQRLETRFREQRVEAWSTEIVKMFEFAPIGTGVFGIKLAPQGAIEARHREEQDSVRPEEPFHGCKRSLRKGHVLEHVRETDDAESFRRIPLGNVHAVRLDAMFLQGLHASLTKIDADRRKAPFLGRKQKRAIPETDVKPYPVRHVLRHPIDDEGRNRALLLHVPAGLLVLVHLAKHQRRRLR